MTKKVEEKKRELEQSSEKAGSDDVSLDDSFFCWLDDGSVFCQVDRGKPSEKSSTVRQVDESRIGLNKESLIDAQGKDSELVGILSEEEAGKERVCFYRNGEVLTRKWRPVEASLDEDRREVHQVVVPKVFRRQILSVSHEVGLSGHLGVNKTSQRLS